VEEEHQVVVFVLEMAEARRVVVLVLAVSV